MRVEKEKRKVKIVCQDGYIVKGFIHLNPGERVKDFINDAKENFIAVTDAESYIHSDSTKGEMVTTIILNKSRIYWIEEI